LNFRNDYPDYKVYKLEQNYRSTQTIVNAANSVIDKNARQIKKRVYSENEVGDPILVLKTGSDHEEGHAVANMVQDLKYAKRLHNSDFAVLYRTNAQSRILEEAFRKRNIPYKVYGGLSFYQRKEIKDTLAYLRLIVNPRDNEAFKRIINYPARGIGDTTVSRIEEAAEIHGCSLWEISERLPEMAPSVGSAARTKVAGFLQILQRMMEKKGVTDPYDLVYEVTATTGLIQDLRSDKTPEGVSRIENVEALLNGVKEYVQAKKEEEEPATLESFLESIALLTDDDQDKGEDRDRVSLMTIHASKGLEFNTIFITGLEELLFPGQQSLVSPNDLEEERRLFYVALTRGKSRVVLSYAESRYKWGSPTICSPSRFLQEIDEAYLEAVDFSPVSASPLSKPSPSFSRPDRFGPKSAYHPGPSPGNPVHNNFTASEPQTIKEGMQVEHQRFGTGKVVAIEGSWPDSKATVHFQTSGRKQLLLKFAKLRIIA
ncbi:MAG: ATP-dependent helicase, partial [Bacteroidales bacterium]